MGLLREVENMIYTTQCASPLGVLLLAERDGALTGLWMEGQKYFPALTQEQARPCPDSPVLRAAGKWLDAYFAGERPEISALPLSPEGSDFRRRVWEKLCAIPYGQVKTYGQIARELERERGMWSACARAVGGAVGRNPVSIIIPCHRVVGSNGSLTGYAGGVERKLWLLRREGADLSGLRVPEEGTAL